MKISKVLAMVISLALLIVFSTTGIFAEEKEGKEPVHKIVRVRFQYVGSVSPAELTVIPGTTVIWVNDSREHIELKFTEKQVTRACKSPVHFIVDEDGSFISSRIPQGSVASLCFVEKGTFNYVARKAFSGSISEYRDSFKEYKGKVIVK